MDTYVTHAHLDPRAAEAAEQNETKLADLCTATRVCEVSRGRGLHETCSAAKLSQWVSHVNNNLNIQKTKHPYTHTHFVFFLSFTAQLGSFSAVKNC